MNYLELKELEGQTLTVSNLMDVTGDIADTIELIQDYGCVANKRDDANVFVEVLDASKELSLDSLVKITEVDSI